MNVLIAGGSGFIGSYLSRFLSQKGHTVTVLTRSANKASKLNNAIQWDGKVLQTDLKVDAIINLCGLNIAAKRWSKKVKQQLLDSRLKPTQGIVTFIKNYQSEIKPRLINASAIGFYPSSQESQTEDYYTTSSNTLFSKELVSQWEYCAQTATAYDALVTCSRFGIVLGKGGGMLDKILLSYKISLGAVMGNKNAYLSWIHIHDLCRAILFVMSLDKPKPVYNFTSPQPCTQLAFSKALAKACKRPCFLHVPSFFIEKVFGQMGEELLLANQKIYPQNLEDAGFQFDYKTIDAALENILRAGE